MTAAQARAKILAGIAAGPHREPFTWGGATYTATVPSQRCLDAARLALENHGRAMWLAVLAVGCVELDGELVFKASDVTQLWHDEPQGFLERFRIAIAPFLLESPELPRLRRPVVAR